MTSPETNTTGSKLKRLLALPNDSREKTLFVALALCLVCSILVAGSAVLLRDRQEANRLLAIYNTEK